MPKCLSNHCDVVIVPTKACQNPPQHCRQCRAARYPKLAPVARDQFNTAEKIDAEVQRLTELRAAHLGVIAALEERKANLPVLVDPKELAILRRKADEHDYLTGLLTAEHATAFWDGPDGSYVKRLTHHIAQHPNMLCGRRM